MYKPHGVFPKMQALCWKIEHTQPSWGAPAPCNRHVIAANWKAQLFSLSAPRAVLALF